MKTKLWKISVMSFIIMTLTNACEIVDNDPNKHVNQKDTAVTKVGLEEVARIVANLSLQPLNLQEVHDAVTSSSDNGYDEEYMMKNLFDAPGTGVGDEETKSGKSYTEPLRDLFMDYLALECTKSGSMSRTTPKKYVESLSSSDIQIYWPYSENWDGKTMPIITFDPEDDSDVNIAYELFVDDNGFRQVKEIMVDEEMAKKGCVWVINRNTDAAYTTLQMRERAKASADGKGGNPIVTNAETKAGNKKKSLILKSFTMNQHYDSWFAGASEFFVKLGFLEDFTASTEAELRLYNPHVTDFMVVVKRKQLGIPQECNSILMSDWTENSDACAFMITEDDGGTLTDWSVKAKAYVSGKSYGVEISIPLNRRDDIVWRGKLAYEWFNECSGESWPFGNVDLVFDLKEY